MFFSFSTEWGAGCSGNHVDMMAHTDREVACARLEASKSGPDLEIGEARILKRECRMSFPSPTRISPTFVFWGCSFPPRLGAKACPGHSPNMAWISPIFGSPRLLRAKFVFSKSF